jgi:hypothetical protein
MSKAYAFVTRDQWLNLGLLLPAFFLVNVACAVAIYLRLLSPRGQIY